MNQGAKLQSAECASEVKLEESASADWLAPKKNLEVE